MTTKKVAPKQTPTKKKAPVKRTVRKVTPVTPTPTFVNSAKTPVSMVDKAIDLIKWVDTPFKLFEVILLASLFFFGYFAWDSRVVILEAITHSNKVTNLKETNLLVPVAISLQKDLDAVTVVVHKASLVVNSRTTLLALGPKGARDNSLDGLNSSLFNKDPIRNAAIIAMLNGEVYCDKLENTGKSSEWEIKQGATFICRGGVPPEIGDFDGYISVGFKTEPNDLPSVKTRINLASSEMSR